MSNPTEFTGKDIEKAISHACETLKVSRDQLEIKVISPGSAGIFGLLRKKAIIHATIKEGTVLSTEEASKPSSKERERKKGKHKVYNKRSLKQKKGGKKHPSKSIA